MLAVSCKFNNVQNFYCTNKFRPQSHITWAFKDNVNKNDADVISTTSALIINLMIVGHNLKDLNEIMIYDAKNKNISRTTKTDELENYKQFFPAYEKIVAFYENNQDKFHDDWGGIQGLVGFCKSIIFCDAKKFIIGKPSDYEAIKKALSQFNKTFGESVYKTEFNTISPITDKLYTNIKLALDSEIYDNLTFFEFD